MSDQVKPNLTNLLTIDIFCLLVKMLDPSDIVALEKSGLIEVNRKGESDAINYALRFVDRLNLVYKPGTKSGFWKFVTRCGKQLKYIKLDFIGFHKDREWLRKNSLLAIKHARKEIWYCCWIFGIKNHHAWLWNKSSVLPIKCRKITKDRWLAI